MCTMQAHLSGGQWVELLAAEHPGIAEVKWCRNRFRPFLCIAPRVKPPSPLSCHELIEHVPCCAPFGRSPLEGCACRVSLLISKYTLFLQKAGLSAQQLSIGICSRAVQGSSKLSESHMGRPLHLGGCAGGRVTGQEGCRGVHRGAQGERGAAQGDVKQR